MITSSQRTVSAIAAAVGRHRPTPSCRTSIRRLASPPRLPAALGVIAAGYSSSTTHEHKSSRSAFPGAVGVCSTLFAAAVAAAATATTARCEAPPAGERSAGNSVEDDDDDVDPNEKLPTFSMSEVKRNNGTNGRPVWMTHGGLVYDVTDFIPNHPGGHEKILLAAGGPIEPHWHLYRQHFATDLPMKYMEKMVVGNLAESDQNEVDRQMDELDTDPYDREPKRDASLITHGDQPMNAEVPNGRITDSYLTPNELFYIRHHHPVPFLSEKEVRDYELTVDLSVVGGGKGAVKLSLDDLRKLPQYDVVATLQCSGNRRSGFNDHRRTSGTPWGQGAVSTARWSGPRLVDVLKLAGLDDPVAAVEDGDSSTAVRHVRFESLDGMTASIDAAKAVSPFGDCILALEMNGKPLPRDHGYPLRVLVPGYAAVRNVKWVTKIELAAEEAKGAWQRGLNYKILPPSVTNAKEVELDRMPGLGEVSLFSGITNVETGTDKPEPEADGYVTVKATGWAWAGGGRNIVRVDVTGDGGKSWESATVTHGANQRHGRAWAWVFWTCDVPARVQDDGTLELCSKSVDSSFNSQPENSDHLWNVRGLANNSWFRCTKKVVED